MKLTVGVCTINGREDLCTRIVTKLYEQAMGKDVQILWVGDNRKWSLSLKRRKVYQMSEGSEYLVMVDDDDDIADNYIDKLLEAIDLNIGVDLINFTMIYENGEERKPVFFSSKFENLNFETHFERRSHTLMCWRMAVLSDDLYEDTLYNEDSKFAEKAYSRVKSEVCLREILYFYKYNELISTQNDEHKRISSNLQGE